MVARPIYETAAHKAIEDEAKAMVEERRNCQIKSTVPGSVFDWGVFRRGVVKEFAEFKARYISLRDRQIKKEGVMLSKKKIDTIKDLCIKKTHMIGSQVNFVYYCWTLSGPWAFSCEPLKEDRA